MLICSSNPPPSSRPFIHYPLNEGARAGLWPGSACLRAASRRARRERRPSPRYQFRLGSRDRFSKHQEDQGIARERFHHGEQNRPHGRSAGSDFNRNFAVTLRDADGLVATGGGSKGTSPRHSSATVGPQSALVRLWTFGLPQPPPQPAGCFAPSPPS